MRRRLVEFWNFDWGVMDVLVNGKSAIDLAQIQVRTWESATAFLKHYGYDPDHPTHAKFIHGLLVEAIDFISKYLMPTEWTRGLRPPQEFFSIHDVRHLMLWASDSHPDRSDFQIWACAILRVMHTIAHIDGVRRRVDIDSARAQIMGHLSSFVFKDDSGKLRFGKGELSVALQKVEWKNNKRRESIIMKLLHKKGNVAETIYDFLGIRIVTERLSDTLVAIRLLQELYVVSYPNCNPTRAKNTLVDMERFRASLDVLLAMYKQGQIEDDDFADMLERAVGQMDDEQPGATSNPHSSADYRSVQLTCRQLVYSKTGAELWRDRVIELTSGNPKLTEFSKATIERLLAFGESFAKVYPDPNLGYFPFEIHILDKATYVNNHTGEASHDRYKSSQIREVRRRILGRILTTKTR